MTAHDLTTGLSGLDRALRGLLPGDNVVWLVNSVDDYAPFVEPYCRSLLASARKLIYFRFAEHPALLSAESGAEIRELKPEQGFEKFITDIHKTIEEAGRGAFYAFDCLSNLASDWHSDQMLGNFFMLTCPYLFDLETIAYFALRRNYHSFHAAAPIAETAQVLLDVYRHKGKIYVHPLKVQHRHSSTMYMLHVREGEDFVPVTDSATNSEVLQSAPMSALDSGRYRIGAWSRTFLEAERLWEAWRGGASSDEEVSTCLRRLLRMVFSREERVLRLAEKHFTLGDIVDVRRRMIGTGLIGGKSVGMLLARAILRRTAPHWADLLEPHDSFFIGSDVFYTYLVHNGCWSIRQRQSDPRTFLDGAERVRQRMLRGTFPDHIRRQFADMLDYFGQSPIIVRSSSLLEDNFGNAFAGKYESVFCANQGPRETRLEDFMSAVRSIYASTMSEKALTYRARRGLLDRDEQMGLLVQRVSGNRYGCLFYSQVSGVGFSFNPYVWSEYIDPNAGVLRLVFGLGTRAVDRTDDDYTRVVALNAPERRPESAMDAGRQYAQRKVDVLDLEANLLVTREFPEVVRQSTGLSIEKFASRDEAAERLAKERGRKESFPWVLTFEDLLSNTAFVARMREMLHILQEAYEYPVDVEYTANFLPDRGMRINLLQCRPLQVQGDEGFTELPVDVPPERLLLKAQGAVIGRSRTLRIGRLIYVAPSVYGQMSIRDRHSVARLIGQITRLGPPGGNGDIMLLGPGRWGTTTPSLGVPVTFSEISGVSVLCEIVAMREDLVPDVSLGTHFSSEMIETDMLYLALFPEKAGNLLNEEFFSAAPNKLPEILPAAAAQSYAVKVIDAADLANGEIPRVYANTLKQQVVCCLEKE